MPGQHVCQKINFFLQAGNGRPPCAGRERASDRHPGMRPSAQPRGPTQHPLRRGSHPSTSKCGWFGSPTPPGCSAPAHWWSQSQDMGSARVLVAFGMVFTPQMLEAAEPRWSRQAAHTRCSGAALCPCTWGHTVAPSKEGHELHQKRHPTAALLLRGARAVLAGWMADPLRAVGPLQEQAGDT